jgi:hypothetical protein
MNFMGPTSSLGRLFTRGSLPGEVGDGVEYVDVLLGLQIDGVGLTHVKDITYAN